MIITHNILAMNAQRQFNIVGNKKAKSMERLSSGYRINRAADDAAGLAISEKMRRQIRGLTQASANCQDGISFVQVADGALNEVHDMLQRINELAIHSANGTNSDEDREYMDKEVQQLKEELDRVFNNTSYNELKIWLAPYIPTVGRNMEELDFATYNDTASGHTGGVSVCNVRYNWKELGLQDKIDPVTDTFKVDGTYQKRLENGEMLELKYVKDAPISSISRIYRWSADNSGITINENSGEKITWAQMGLDTSNIEAKTYSFEYHGTEVSFDTEDGATLDKVIEAINGDGISGVNWQTQSAGMVTHQALNLSGFTKPDITAGNQKYLMDTSWTINADENGVRLTSDNNSYTDKAWASFSDGSGDYPIADWGTSGEMTNPVSLDNTATYKYTDSNTGFSFNFKLTDEASREAAIDALDGTKVNKSFSATAYNAVDNTEDINISVSTSAMSFGMQNALGRNMYESANFSVATGLSYNAAKLTNDLSLTITGRDTNFSTKQTARYTSSITNDNIKSYLKYGNKITKTFSLVNTADFTFTDEEKDEGLKAVNNSISVTYDFSKISAEYNAEISAINAIYNTNNSNNINAFASAIKSKLGGINVTGVSDSALNSLASGMINNFLSNLNYYTTASNSEDNRKTTVYNNLKSYKPADVSDADWNDMIAKVAEDFRLYGENAEQIKLNRENALSTNDTTYLNKAKNLMSRSLTASADKPTMTMTYGVKYQSSFENIENIKVNPPMKKLDIQAGTENNPSNVISIEWEPLNTSILAMTSTNVLSQGTAVAAMATVKGAMRVISDQRSYFGAMQNRMEHTIRNLDNVIENTTAAESRIRDTQMDEEAVALSTQSILQQAGQAMLAQANQSKQGVLTMLQ